MTRLGFEERIADEPTLSRAIAHCRDRGIRLPRFAELTDPTRIPAAIVEGLSTVEPDDLHPENLFRLHWYNARHWPRFTAVPAHVVLPPSLTGVPARIVVALGDRFPLIHAHEALADYACLVPRLVTGKLDPTRDRTLWPASGNHARGGVAISKILGCRSAAVVPENTSREALRWLARHVTDPASDIVRTPGDRSELEEYQHACAGLARGDGRCVVMNPFSDFANHLAHRVVTGPALARLFEVLWEKEPHLRLAAFVSATGTAGTLGAGDHLKDHTGARIVAAEPLECPTLLYAGFGSHNIQGIGKRHVPLIHNVMNTDIVTAVSDKATDQLLLLFGDPVGHEFLREHRGVPHEIIAQLRSFGLSSICNVLASIKTARYLGLGPDDVILTIATDGANLYESEIPRILTDDFDGSFDPCAAAAAHGEHILGASAEHLLELRHTDRTRIFNLGYYTWVEQRGVPVADFEARRAPSFWNNLLRLPSLWDDLIGEFNRRIEARS